MFCVNCGAKLEDGAKFCTLCGTQQSAPTEELAAEETAVVSEETAQDVAAEEAGDVEVTGLVLFGKTFSKKVVAIAAAAVAAVALIAILLVVLLPGATSPKAAAEEYVKAVFACEADEIIAVMPTQALKTIRKNNEMSAREYENRMDEIMESMDEDMDDYFGARRKVSVKVEQTEKLSKSQLRSLQEIYKEAKYGSVSDARIMKVKISLNGNEESGSGTVKVSVVKQGGRWFINPLDTNPYSLIYAID